MKQFSTLSLAIFTGLAIVGVIVVMISLSIKAEAEREYLVEERVVGTRNKMILATQKAQRDFEKQRQDAEKERQFNQSLYGTSSPPPEVIQQQIERHLRKLAESTPKAP